MMTLLKICNTIRIDIFLYFKYKILSVKWRNKNKHNEVSLKNIVNIDIIKVGKGSYGELCVHSFGNKKEKLVIGNYVSIASNVCFILGGNHQINTLSNYPIESKFIALNPEKDAQTKGEIIVEDEVWIGTNVILMSGVRVGKGAIIAAGSVVTKDVPPFSIVGGNPSRFIKYRIDEELIPEVKNIDLINIDRDKIIENIDLFYQKLDENILKKIKDLK